MGRIEAGAVTQALVGSESNNGPIWEVDAECIDLIDADAKTDDNNSVDFQQSHNVLNWTARDVPVVTNLCGRLFDVGGLKSLTFVDWDARHIEVGQRDVFFELKCKLPREVDVGERLLTISRGGGTKATEEPVGLISGGGAGWSSEKRRRYAQRDREPTKRRCGGLRVSVLELAD